MCLPLSRTTGMFNILDAVMKKAWPSAKTALPKEIDDAKVRSRLASSQLCTRR